MLVQVECTSYVTVTLGWHDSSLWCNERKNSLSAKAKFIDMVLNAISFLVIKHLSGVPSECLTVWTHIRPDILSGLTICIVLSADNLCKQFGPRSGPTYWSGPTKLPRSGQTFWSGPTKLPRSGQTFWSGPTKFWVLQNYQDLARHFDQARQNFLSGLMLVQTVCKGYQ